MEDETVEDVVAPAADTAGGGLLLRLNVGMIFFLFYGFWLVAAVWSRGFFPSDFLVFHGAGGLFAEGDWELAYDLDAFQEHLVSEYGSAFVGSEVDTTETLAHFLNPPPFGWSAQVLGWLPIGPSFAAFAVVNVLLGIVAFRSLDLPMKALPILLLSPMMTMNLGLGQTGSLSLIATVGVHLFMTRDRRIAAGLLAGVFIMKPPLAFGYGLLWLVKHRQYAISIVMSLVGGLALSLPMLPNGLNPWRAFLANAAERTSLDQRIGGRSLSFAEFVKPFWYTAPTGFTLAIWGIGIGFAAFVLVSVNRRYRGDIELLSAAAVTVTVMFSPHVLLYDSLILVIPVAVAYTRGALNSERVGLVVLLLGFGLSNRLLPTADVLGPVSLDFPALVAASYLLARWVDEAVSSNSGKGLGLPVGPDAAAIDRERNDLVIGE